LAAALCLLYFVFGLPVVRANQAEQEVGMHTDSAAAEMITEATAADHSAASEEHAQGEEKFDAGQAHKAEARTIDYSSSGRPGNRRPLPLLRQPLSQGL